MVVYEHKAGVLCVCVSRLFFCTLGKEFNGSRIQYLAELKTFSCNSTEKSQEIQFFDVSLTNFNMYSTIELNKTDINKLFPTYFQSQTSNTVQRSK